MKIGRNDPCPCGSGQKYKKCCQGKVAFKPVTDQPAPQVTLKNEIAKLQEVAAKKEKMIKPLGVFIMFSTDEGDAWLLEISEMDALQVAEKGEKIEIEMNENPETIEINWSHHFSIRKKQFITTAYADKKETIWPDYPAHSIFAAIKRIRKKFPKEILNKIHLNEEDVSVG